MRTTNTLIIGASAAGLACAARLLKKNIDFIILEKEGVVAHAWRSHYDRLHLHTNKASSQLPYIKFPKGTPKYPSRDQLVRYMENYCTVMRIQPEFNTTVTHIEKTGNTWNVQTDKEEFQATNVIVCTGNTNVPKRIDKPGLSDFPGTILHSAEYKNGKAFTGKNVLVIGFGNSACEIAICLHEHGALPAMSVRSPVNVIPRDVFGIPVLQLGISQAFLPPRIADKLNAPLLRLLVGDITKSGLKKLPYGPTEQIVHHHQIPLLDIGTMDLIKKDHIKIFGDIERVDQDTIHFEDNKQMSFDAIIMATGYKTGLESMVELTPERKMDLQRIIKKRNYFGKDSLYFCGFYVAPTGMIREATIESKIIADRIVTNKS